MFKGVRAALLTLSVAAFGAGVPGAPGAQAAGKDVVAYKCTISGAGEYDWIQPLIFIAHNRTDNIVSVTDPLILGVNDGVPAVGRVTTDNAKRTTFAWEVDVTLRKSPITFRYRATYVKADGSVQVSAMPERNSRNFSNGGTCAMEKLKG